MSDILEKLEDAAQTGNVLYSESIAEIKELKAALKLSQDAIQAYCDSENEMKATRDVYKAMLEHCGIDPNTGEPVVVGRTKTQSEQDDYDALVKRHKEAIALAEKEAKVVPGVSGTIAEDCVITGDKLPGEDEMKDEYDFSKGKRGAVLPRPTGEGGNDE